MFNFALFTSTTAARRATPLALLATLLLAGCDKDESGEFPAAEKLPDAVAFTQLNLYPEGVQYDEGRFLVSSQTAGAVGQVGDDGSYSVFADNPALVSTIGLRLDTNRNRLLVAVADPGYNTTRTTAATKGKLARLAIFNRGNPSATPVVLDLGGLRPAAAGHFANDIAVDAQGNSYITDSFAPLIYKVNVASTPTVFAENQLFSAPAGTFGLNGIVYHPDGYLLVGKSDEGALFKVNLATNAVSRVAIGQDLRGADGLLLGPDNTLQVACNAQAKVYRLASTDGWATATVSGTFSTPSQYPTTLTLRQGLYGGELASYVLYSNLNALQAMQTPPVSVFTIAKVKF